MNLRDARIIAFDNDGTLYPAGEQVGRTVLDAHREYVRLKGLDLETPGYDWVTQMIGADAKHFYPAMMPGQPSEVVAGFEEFCLDCETRAVFENNELYPGAHELLADLTAAGKTLVLVSNGGPRYVQSVWDAAGYGRYFSKSYPFAAPDYLSKGERLALAITEHGGGTAVMVGDRASDREAAEFAGVPLIGCAYGYGADGELEGAAVVINAIDELRRILLAGEAEVD